MSNHVVPSDLSTWLQGWRPTPNGNFCLRTTDGDVYVVYKARGPGWAASVGRTFLSERWPDPEQAKRGLFDAVTAATEAQLSAWHTGGPAPVGKPPPTPTGPHDDRSTHNDCDLNGEPDVLLVLPRGADEVRLVRRSYRGRPYLALASYRAGREVKQVSIRYHEAAALAVALSAAAAGPDPGHQGQAVEHDRPRYVDRGPGPRPPWEAEKLQEARPAPAPGGAFDEFSH